MSSADEPQTRSVVVEREIPFLKAYSVFNVAQIDGLPAHYYASTNQKADKLELIEAAERFFSATGAIIRHGGDQAYYSPGTDVIQLPVPEAFRDAESYAATKAHELTHWTSHPQRVARDFGGKRFGAQNRPVGDFTILFDQCRNRTAASDDCLVRLPDRIGDGPVVAADQNRLTFTVHLLRVAG